MSFTNRKRKYVEEKMTGKLKHKQTSIATVRYHLLPVASLLTPLIFHYPLPLTDWHINPLKHTIRVSYILEDFLHIYWRITYIRRLYYNHYVSSTPIYFCRKTESFLRMFSYFFIKLNIVFFITLCCFLFVL